MSHQIAALNLEKAHDDFSILSDTGKRVLEGLNRINLFVGPNNSGKSRFLRELARMEKLSFKPATDLSIYRDITNQFKTRIRELKNQHGSDADNFDHDAQTLPTFEFIDTKTDILKPLRDLVQRTLNAQTHFFHFQQIKNAGQIAHKALTERNQYSPVNWEFHRIYIPTLRGLRPFGSEDNYRLRTEKDYFKGAKELTVATGLDLYTGIRALLLGNRFERQTVRRFEQFLGKWFFEGQEVTIIPREQDDVLYVKIGDEEDHPIHQLGDGIQMIICMLFPLFQSKAEHILMFIEEPDLYLHPGLQRTFVHALASLEKVQCFVATHSNHLMDLTLDRDDIAIFSVRKELVATGDQKKARSKIERVSSGETRILHELGVRNSSVFLSNCTIWVEGITDRRYLRAFLQLYMTRDLAPETRRDFVYPYKEDLHYSFVEYGGSNITHWSFLDSTTDAIDVQRLCARLMLVADKDDSDTKDARHEKLKSRLKERYVVYQRREIENLLTTKNIESVLRIYEGVNAEFNSISYEDYKNELLGNFIENKWLKKRLRDGTYAAKSGTLTDKLKFCERAIEQLKSFNDLSPDAQKIAEALFTFIKANNTK